MKKEVLFDLYLSNNSKYNVLKPL